MTEACVQHLLAAIEAPERLNQFAVQLRTLVHADAAVVRFLNTRTWQSPLTAACGQPPFTPEFFDAYDREYARTDPHVRVAMRKTLPRGNIYFCHEHYSPRMRQGDPYFQFVARHGVAWTAGYMAQLSECEAVGFCAVRGPQKPHFGERERDCLSPIASILRDWAKAFWFARVSAAAARAAQGALGMGLEGAICMDDEKRALWEAPQVDLSALGLERFGGRIRAISPDDERSLAEAVACAANNSAHPLTTLHMRQREFALCGDGGGPGPHAVVLGWRAVRPAPDSASPEPMTHAEHETLNLLAVGLSPDQIAKRRNVRISTVRTQIKRLYRKLGVHNLAQLLAKTRP